MKKYYKLCVDVAEVERVVDVDTKDFSSDAELIAHISSLSEHFFNEVASSWWEEIDEDEIEREW